MAELSRPRRPRSVGQRAGRLLKAFGALTGAGGVMVLALQAIAYFEEGFWTPGSLLDLWLWMGNSYSIRGGGQGDRIALWVLDLPLGPTLLAVALGLLVAGRAIDR